MRIPALVVVVTLAAVGCNATSNVTSKVSNTAKVKLAGKVVDFQGSPVPQQLISWGIQGQPLLTGRSTTDASGGYAIELDGKDTKDLFTNHPYVYKQELAGPHGEWTSQTFTVTSENQTLSTIKFWDDVTPAIDDATGDLKVKWAPPAGMRVTKATLYVSQDLQDVWSVALTDLKGGTYTIPGAVLNDGKRSNVKVKTEGTPSNNDSANHDFTTGAVAATKILKVASIKGSDATDYGHLTNDVLGQLDLVRPDTSTATPMPKDGVVLDLGSSQAIGKLAFYGKGGAKLTITASDQADGKGGKALSGGAGSSILDLGGVKARYVRLEGAPDDIYGLAEVRAIAP